MTLASRLFTPRILITLSALVICVGCFLRDISGALGLHSTGSLQYLRPEIGGFVLGSFAAAYAFNEFRARGGSAPLARFLLGMFTTSGADSAKRKEDNNA